MITRCLGCGRKVKLSARKGRCSICLPLLDARRNAITPAIRAQVIDRDGGVCQIRRPGCTRVATEVDHILALSKGGRDVMGNFQSACKSCNSSKRDR